jgi:cytochrome P450
MRLETLTHSGISHRSLEEGELQGYTIPQNSYIYSGLHTLNNDKKIWGDPENFRPERFLGDDGKVCLKKDVSLPFSAGKRLCAGETFARNTLFLCYTAILQNFNIKTPDGSLPDLSKRTCGLTTAPEDFWLKLEAR